MTVPTNLDLHLGSPVLPEQVKRARTDHRGALSLMVETEHHDRGLLYSIAATVREHTEAVELLTEFADLVDHRDRAETHGDHPLRRSLEDEIEDKLGELDALMADQTVGEAMTVSLSPAASGVLAEALTAEGVAA